MKKHEAMEEIMSNYGKLSDMAELAGYSREDAEKWCISDDIPEMQIAKKYVKKQRRNSILFSLFSVFAFVFFLEIFTFTPYHIALCLLSLGVSFLFYRQIKKVESNFTAEKLNTELYNYFISLSDQYTKKTINSIAFFITLLTLYLFSQYNFYITGNLKISELKENIMTNIIVIEVPLYILIHNCINFILFRNRINAPRIEKLKKHIVGISVFSISYWLIVSLIILLSNSIYYPMNILLVTALLFMMFIITYDFKIRKKLTHKNVIINKKRIVIVTFVAVVMSGIMYLQKDTWYTQPYINSVPVIEHNSHKIEYDDETGIYTITSSTDDFKILHLTDIHLGGSLYSYRKDIKALKTCYTELEYTKPDLVVVTGDLCFPMGIMSMSLNNYAPVGQFATFMRNTGIPWVFTYGNHDTESIATYDEMSLDEVYKSLSYKTSGNLLYPYKQPEITGRNNQLVEIRNNDGTLNTALFLIDSNAYIGNGVNDYDYIHDDQVDWYVNQIKRLSDEESYVVNSLVFFHIPLQEYRTAYELYEKGSDEVKYFFGANGEKMSCSDHPSKMFETAKELGSTTGFFCGHDHYNNLSVAYQGIRLTYGMSIDYLAMPGIENDDAQRGAELITLHSDSSWDLEQIPLSNINCK